MFVDPGAAEKDPFIVRPEETYHSPYPSNTLINLRIATGGAGQSGLIRALADTFIADTCSDDKEAPFGVAWLKSDISTSFNYLAQNAADVSITYHTVAEDIAIQQGIVERRLYAWRDHWMLVGPASNPAALPYPPDPDRTVHTLFGYIFRAAIRSQGSSNPVRFLSRWDKSACNIKESFIWTSIGMVPWAEPKSEWYHTCMADPFTALRIATENGEYTLTDRGTWIASGAEKAEMRVYVSGFLNITERNGKLKALGCIEMAKLPWNRWKARMVRTRSYLTRRTSLSGNMVPTERLRKSSPTGWEGGVGPRKLLADLR